MLFPALSPQKTSLIPGTPRGNREISDITNLLMNSRQEHTTVCCFQFPWENSRASDSSCLPNQDLFRLTRTQNTHFSPVLQSSIPAAPHCDALGPMSPGTSLQWNKAVHIRGYSAHLSSVPFKQSSRS